VSCSPGLLLACCRDAPEHRTEQHALPWHRPAAARLRTECLLRHHRTLPPAWTLPRKRPIAIFGRRSLSYGGRGACRYSARRRRPWIQLCSQKPHVGCGNLRIHEELHRLLSASECAQDFLVLQSGAVLVVSLAKPRRYWDLVCSANLTVLDVSIPEQPERNDGGCCTVAS
jgi:hypothetical protein